MRSEQVSLSCPSSFVYSELVCPLPCLVEIHTPPGPPAPRMADAASGSQLGGTSALGVHGGEPAAGEDMVRRLLAPGLSIQERFGHIEGITGQQVIFEAYKVHTGRIVSWFVASSVLLAHPWRAPGVPSKPSPPPFTSLLPIPFPSYHETNLRAHP